MGVLWLLPACCYAWIASQSSSIFSKKKIIISGLVHFVSSAPSDVDSDGCLVECHLSFTCSLLYHAVASLHHLCVDTKRNPTKLHMPCIRKTKDTTCIRTPREDATRGMLHVPSSRQVFPLTHLGHLPHWIHTQLVLSHLAVCTYAQHL